VDLVLLLIKLSPVNDIARIIKDVAPSLPIQPSLFDPRFQKARLVVLFILLKV
jgi:hypothetical protein